MWYNFTLKIVSRQQCTKLLLRLWPIITVLRNAQIYLHTVDAYMRVISCWTATAFELNLRFIEVTSAHETAQMEKHALQMHCAGRESSVSPLQLCPLSSRNRTKPHRLDTAMKKK